jgi:hypothetical protein
VLPLWTTLLWLAVAVVELELLAAVVLVDFAQELVFLLPLEQLIRSLLALEALA